MSAEQMPDLIDRLGRAALECREAIREAHGATKDLRQATAEARDVMAALRVAAQEEARADVRAIVEEVAVEQLEHFGDEIAAQRDRACERIMRSFDEFAEPLLQSLVEIRAEIDHVRDRVQLPPTDFKVYVPDDDQRAGKRYKFDVPHGNGHGQ